MRFYFIKYNLMYLLCFLAVKNNKFAFFTYGNQKSTNNNVFYTTFE